MKKTTIRCPYCGARATLRPSSVVYGERAKPGGYLYICDRYPKCDAYRRASKDEAADGYAKHLRRTKPIRPLTRCGGLANGRLTDGCRAVI
ncbi:MAG: zinc-finger-containing protein [Lachnospiraceae bacterium]